MTGDYQYNKACLSTTRVFRVVVQFLYRSGVLDTAVGISPRLVTIVSMRRAARIVILATFAALGHATAQDVAKLEVDATDAPR